MKKLVLQFTATALTLILAGCGTSLKVIHPYEPITAQKVSYTIIPNKDVPEKALVILRERLDADLTKAGLLSTSSTPKA